MLEVVAPGLLTTIQDGGRPDLGALGVPVGGACDPWALSAANLLLGNHADAAAIEITLAGAELAAVTDSVVAIAGADLGATIVGEDRAIRPGTSAVLWAGTRLRFSTRRRGTRAYLTVPGGFSVPIVLGSRSTSLMGGFGGIEGRSLRTGDRLQSARPNRIELAGRSWPESVPSPYAPSSVPLRVVAGPDRSELPAVAWESLLDTRWRVAASSDRMGLRLEGPPLEMIPGELVSVPTVLGAIQVPPAGQPLVLLADRGTVGGYPVLAVVVAADIPRLAQLAPGDGLAFSEITIEQAQVAYRQQRADLRRAARLLAVGDQWEMATALADSR